MPTEELINSPLIIWCISISVNQHKPIDCNKQTKCEESVNTPLEVEGQVLFFITQCKVVLPDLVSVLFIVILGCDAVLGHGGYNPLPWTDCHTTCHGHTYW